MARPKVLPRVPIELALKLQRRPDGSLRSWEEVGVLLKEKHGIPPAPHAAFSRTTLASAAFNHRKQRRSPNYNVIPE